MLFVVLLLTVPRLALAQATLPDATSPATTVAEAGQPAEQAQQTSEDPQATTPRPRVAAEYSDAYETRRKIHYYASWATLPLFVTQYAVGNKLYDGTGSGSTRSAHTALGVSIGALFGVNTVTGVWNLWEARSDPNGRKRRLIHGISMLGADAGFLATGMLAPDEHGSGNRAMHRNVALTSMGVAAGSYLYMLFTR
jgi:hypothetical protein